MATSSDSYQILGDSAWAQETRKRTAQIARLKYQVVITGPRGTGKQYVARGIHLQSGRAEKPFVPVDCSQLRGETFASQLFGHEAGAFAASDGSALGALRVANGGTVFLGRVDSLPLEQQQQLLEVLRTQKVKPLGSSEMIAVDARFISSSLSDLQKEVQGQCFMPELYNRLEAVSLPTIDLCHRVEDVEPLAEAFLEQAGKDHGQKVKRLGKAALGRLESYVWPGNISELQLVIQRAVLLSSNEILDASDFASLTSDS